MTAPIDDDHGTMGWWAAIGLVVSSVMINLLLASVVLRPLLVTLGVITSGRLVLAGEDASHWIFAALAIGVPLLLAWTVLAAKGWTFSRMACAFGAVLAFITSANIISSMWLIWIGWIKPGPEGPDFVTFIPLFALW